MKDSERLQRSAEIVAALCDPSVWEPGLSKVARRVDKPVSTVFDVYERERERVRKAVLGVRG